MGYKAEKGPDNYIQILFWLKAEWSKVPDSSSDFLCWGFWSPNGVMSLSPTSDTSFFSSP